MGWGDRRRVGGAEGAVSWNAAGGWGGGDGGAGGSIEKSIFHYRGAEDDVRGRGEGSGGGERGGECLSVYICGCIAYFCSITKMCIQVCIILHIQTQGILKSHDVQ